MILESEIRPDTPEPSSQAESSARIQSSVHTNCAAPPAPPTRITRLAVIPTASSAPSAPVAPTEPPENAEPGLLANALSTPGNPEPDYDADGRLTARSKQKGRVSD
jgi:hypothetical protein